MEKARGEQKESNGKWERVNQVIDNLNRAAWKLQGIVGLCFDEGDGGKVLSTDQTNGLGFLLDQIADDILANANLITDAKQSELVTTG